MAPHPTMSFEKPSIDDRFRILPPGISALEVVTFAREAGLAFLVGSAFGWGTKQLRSWLVLDYEPAINWTRIPDGRAPHDPLAGLDEVDVATLVDSTRARMMDMLLTARVTWNHPTFARDMVDTRLAVAIYDREGEEAYAPALHADMRLIDRVMSLFIADYLTRPSAYDRIVSCDACGEVAIGTPPRHPCWCAEPPAQSGIVERLRSGYRYDGVCTLRGVG